MKKRLRQPKMSGISFVTVYNYQMQDRSQRSFVGSKRTLVRSTPHVPEWLLKATSIGPTYLDLCPMTPILSAGSRKETQLLNRPRKPETNATDTTVSLKSLLTGHLGLEPPSISEEPLVSEKIL